MLLCTPVPAGSSLVGPEEKFRAGVNLVLLFLRGWKERVTQLMGWVTKITGEGQPIPSLPLAPTGPEQSQCLLPTVGLAWVQDSGEVGEGVGFKVLSGFGRADAGGKAENSQGWFRLWESGQGRSSVLRRWESLG